MIFPTIRPSILSTLMSSVASTGLADYLLDLYGGANAAYSLRKLKGSYRDPVVEVRRASDNTTASFTADQVSGSEMTDWVNGTVALPLDTAANASAAYSLRSLGTNQWSYGGDTDKLDLQTESGGLTGNVTNETATGFDFSVNNEGANGFKGLLLSGTTEAGSYVATLDVVLNSGSLTGCNLYHDYLSSGVITPLTAGANSISLTSDASNSIFFYILATAVADVSITNLTLTKTLGDSNYLPTGKYVTQVRRTNDDQVRSFTALEVSDGTMQDWVNGHVVTYTSDFSAGNDGWGSSNGTRDGDIDGIGPVGDVRDDNLRFNVGSGTSDLNGLNLNNVAGGLSYNVSFDILIPSSNLAINGFGVGGRPDRELIPSPPLDVWISHETTINPTSSGAWYVLALQSGSSTVIGNGTDVFYIRNVVVTQTSVDKLDLQPATGGLVGNVTNETATGFDFSVNNEGSIGFKVITTGINSGYYTITFNVVLNSGSFTGVRLYRTLSGNPFESFELQSGENSINTTSDGVGNFYFRTDATAVADVSITNITLVQTTADGHVTTWYDQSGNTKHATQGTPASQPKIVDAGVLVAGGIDFDGVDDFLEVNMTGINAATALSTFNVITPAAAAAVNSETMSAWSMGSVTVQRGLGLSSSTSALSNEKIVMVFDDGTGGRLGSSSYSRASNERSLLTSFNLNSGTSLFAQGSSVLLDLSSGITISTPSSPSDAGYVTDDIVFLGALRGATAIGFTAQKVQEMIFYPSDESANRVAIESNIGDHYAISGIPSYDDTVDGFVSTWYDQSGNGNDATQATPASQPKVVDAGVLVAGGIDFDGVDDYFQLDLGANLTQPNSFFMSQTSDTTNSAFNEFFDTTGGSPRTLLDIGTGYRLTAGVSLEDASFTAETNRVLFSAFANSTSSFIGKNGVSSAFGDAGTEGINRFSSIAKSGIRYYDGKMDEFIIYNSDESANRIGIETNVNDYYDIFTDNGYENAAGDFYLSPLGQHYTQP